MSLRVMMDQQTVVWPWDDIKVNMASAASAGLLLRGIFKGTPAFVELYRLEQSPRSDLGTSDGNQRWQDLPLHRTAVFKTEWTPSRMNFTTEWTLPTESAPARESRRTFPDPSDFWVQSE